MHGQNHIKLVHHMFFFCNKSNISFKTVTMNDRTCACVKLPVSPLSVCVYFCFFDINGALIQICSLALSQNCEKWLLVSLIWRLSVRRCFLLSVFPSVRPRSTIQQFNSHWKEFHKMLCLRIFRIYVETVQVWLKYDKNSDYCTWRPMYIYDNTEWRTKNQPAAS